MPTTSLFIKPIDVLFLRGNKLFGGPGDHGDVLMPPWPSVFTGAICSKMLADNNLLGRAAEMGNNSPALIDELAGSLFLELLALADKTTKNLYFPAPSDIVINKDKNSMPVVYVVRPVMPAALADCASSATVHAPASIRTATPVKPDSGWWLTLDVLKKHLSGENIEAAHLVKAAELWSLDPRLGIALDSGSRTADKGRIYTSDTVAMNTGIGFLASFRHEKGSLPAGGLVRLGGDGRGAEIFPFHNIPSELGKPQEGWKRFRMILSTPCPSPNGWLPPGVVEKGNDEYVLETAGFRARLYSASVTRHEIISGWDIARHAPKPALRMIPSGSVYWFEVEEGDCTALEEIWSAGLLDKVEDDKYTGRRREGFGRVWFGKA